MISKCSALATIAALLAATWFGTAHADDTKLTVIVFPGVQNLPMFAAQAKGFFAKRGLAVDLKFTPNFAVCTPSRVCVQQNVVPAAVPPPAPQVA